MNPLPFTLSGAALPVRLYDAIMAEIEPELTSQMAPTLKERYQRETTAEKAERMARYEQAFALFDEMVPKVMSMFEDDALDEAMDVE